MPWVSVHTAAAVPAGTQETVKAEIGKILADELRKEEQGLFVTFQHVDGLYRAGARDAAAAVLEVRYIGRYDLAAKQQVTRRACRLLAASLDLDAQKIIVLFREMDSADWGRKGGEYS